ncbi:MAG: hypothetical protein FJW90_09250 [Actinobacteria bacterium]|nr:hypothetical protein [Actinomycetota bacterium]
MLWLWIDGRLEDRRDGPGGDISCPDDGVPTDSCGGPCTWSDPFLVIGAEKHDAGSAYPSFHGWVDELRLSTRLRYTRAFSPPDGRFRVDAGTAALYHLVWGDRDPLVPLSFCAHVHEALPEARQVVLQGCGHVPQVEMPEDSNGLVHDFIDSAQASARARAAARIGRAARRLRDARGTVASAANA